MASLPRGSIGLVMVKASSMCRSDNARIMLHCQGATIVLAPVGLETGTRVEKEVTNTTLTIRSTPLQGVVLCNTRGQHDNDNDDDDDDNDDDDDDEGDDDDDDDDDEDDDEGDDEDDDEDDDGDDDDDEDDGDGDDDDDDHNQTSDRSRSRYQIIYLYRRSCTCRYEVLCRIYIRRVQVQRCKFLLDHADHTVPTRQLELDHTNTIA